MPGKQPNQTTDDRVALSGYRMMWLFAMFDLPVNSRLARRDYARFRNFLLKDGFMKMQFSVYMRHCATMEHCQVHIRRVSSQVPPNGEVRILWITDKQFERMMVFCGKRRKKAENAPRQLEFF